MLSLPALVFVSQIALQPIARDSYGVPQIEAATAGEAFFAMGRAVAQDRLWQMELSRRVARGRMAELMGPSAEASDIEVLKRAYTNEEMLEQFSRFSPWTKELWNQYVAGVNAEIEARKASGNLPEGYKQRSATPEPWTLVDSLAIAVRLAQQFGVGGGGELRNFAALQYLKTQPCKERVLDVFDDIAWQNDKDSIPTILPSDDPLAKNPPKFPPFSRKQTEAQLAALPNTSLLELAPAVRLATKEESTKLALNSNVFYKTGSYAIVVAKERSATGVPLLLSGPQMGHSSPSVVHEVAITTPDVKVAGINVPGVPGVIVGYTPNIAWGMTTGVADVADVFVSKLDEAGNYIYGEQHLPLKRIDIRRANGLTGPPVMQARTRYGMVLLESKSSKAVYSLRSTNAFRELESYNNMTDFYRAKSAVEADRLSAKATLPFNTFFATANGDIGYRFCGIVPKRAPGLDPRLPIPGTPENEWLSMMSPDEMPHVINPKSGMTFNWNNKPTAWWPNLDTPIWGRLYRNRALAAAIPEGKLAVHDLERAIWSIARFDDASQGAFMDLFKKAIVPSALEGRERAAAEILRSFDGWQLDGSQPAAIYQATVRALREELFLPHTGNFLAASTFESVAQPTLIWNAVNKKTKYNYLAGRTAEQVALEAFKKACAGLTGRFGPNPTLWRYRAGGITVPDEAPIPYGNRGTYIQIIELFKNPTGRSVSSPGISETGPNSKNQAPLARSWTFKPMKSW